MKTLRDSLKEKSKKGSDLKVEHRGYIKKKKSPSVDDLFTLLSQKLHRKDDFNPDQCYSRLHSLAVAGHVDSHVVRVVQHLCSEQVVLQVTTQLRKLKQFTIVKEGPAGRDTKLLK